MTADEILDEMRANFDKGAGRRFLPGLLIAFAWLLKDLDAVGGRYGSLADFYARFPRQTKTKAGTSANTLIVQFDPTRTVSIRRYYDRIENYFRAEQKRFDYPSSAPHATQAWGDYQHWIEGLLALSVAELDDVVDQAKNFVLDKLQPHEIAAETIKRDPPRFHLFLEHFDLTKHAGEKSGAAYQGTVFGYIRADSSHLQVDVDRVRTGSKRVGRIGDVDAREGDALVLSAEVKQFVFQEQHLADIAEFASLVSRHKALGLVVALDFDDGIRDHIIGLGLEPVAKKDLIERVRLWDPLKQRVAVQALVYYVAYKEQNGPLLDRVRAFFKSIDAQAAAAPDAEPSVDAS